MASGCSSSSSSSPSSSHRLLEATVEALPHSVAAVSIPPSPLLPQPMENLHSTLPPPFLTKTYDMIDDATTNSIVSWSSGSNSFVVWNLSEFSQHLLPRYFKHSKFSSFVRQLNTYGFRKVNPDRWEFAHEGFLRGQKHLLTEIHRRKPALQNVQQQQQAARAPLASPPMLTELCVEVGKFGIEGDIEQLKRDKGVLMAEVVRLRQHQQSVELETQVMAQRVQVAERRQEQMMNFLAKAIQTPAFLAHLKQQSESLRIGHEASKRRRLPAGNKRMEALLDTDSLPGSEAFLEMGKDSTDIRKLTQRSSTKTGKDSQMVMYQDGVMDELHLLRSFETMSEQVTEGLPAMFPSATTAQQVPATMQNIGSISQTCNPPGDSKDRPLFLRLEGSASDLDLAFDLDLIEELLPAAEDMPPGNADLPDTFWEPFGHKKYDLEARSGSSIGKDSAQDEHAVAQEVNSVASGTSDTDLLSQQLQVGVDLNPAHDDEIISH